jgi:hypothetical protein
MPKYSARLFRKNFDGPRIPLPPRNVFNASPVSNPYPTKNSNSQKNSRSRNSEETGSSANAREDFKDQVVEKFVNFLFLGEKGKYKELFVGAYGTGFKIDYSFFRSHVEPYLRTSYRKIIAPRSAVRLNGEKDILMKVQLLDSREREEEAFDEDTALEDISNGTVRYHGLEIQGRDFVPRFILGCTVPHMFTSNNNKRTRIYFRLTFMTFVMGKTLYHYLKSNEVTPLFFANLEKAFTSLWMMGYAHNDAHLWNIMVETRTKKPYIIDFGMSRKLNRSKHDLFMKNLSALASNNAFNKHFLGTMASEWFYNRNYHFFNVDSVLLRSLRQDLNPCDVAKARQKVWASSTSNKNSISNRIAREIKMMC